MGRVIFFILKLTRDAVQPQNKNDFCSDHNKAISHLGLLYGIFMMVYIQHNLFPFHQQVRLRASLVGHFEKSTCLVRATFTSLQRAHFNSQLTTEVILLPTKRCWDVFGDWPHWALLECLCVWYNAFKITDLPLEREKWKVKNFVRRDELHCSVGQEVSCMLTLGSIVIGTVRPMMFSF